MTDDYPDSAVTTKRPKFTDLSGFPHLDPVLVDFPAETDLMDPYAILAEHPDLTLHFTRLPLGERGRWYPDLHLIVISDRLTEAERRCTLTHELVHRMRGDSHVSDDIHHHRQEKSCHQTVARLLIPLDRLLSALRWDRDPHELAQELWVDAETLQSRIYSLSRHEAKVLRQVLEQDSDTGDSDWGVA